MMKHTAGPWIYAENGSVYADNYRKTVIHINGFGASAEDVANARLIAAAPELLEALRRLDSAIEPIRRNLWNNFPALSEAWVVARAAIAKATE